MKHYFQDLTTMGQKVSMICNTNFLLIFAYLTLISMSHYILDNDLTKITIALICMLFASIFNDFYYDLMGDFSL